jgi:tetratricopeptide (TPR) repeat protein
MTMNLRPISFAIIFSLSVGLSQGLAPEAQQALNKGAQAAAQALATYDHQLLDKPLWREAINYGLEAQHLAPNSPEPYRFLGQVYSTVAFYGRAYENWTMYLELGGVANPQTTRYLIEASQWLGSAAYKNGQYEDAVKYYTTLHELQPDSEEANQHLALSYQALGQPEKALPYLRTLSSTLPDRGDYASLYEITQEQSTYGLEVSNAYRTGLAAYNSGNKSDALTSFRQAVQLNNNFENALLYAARTSLELGFSSEAVIYWKRILVLSPNNPEATQALATAEAQARWGAAAYSAFQQGVTFYQQGRYPEAQQAFLSATNQNPRYEEAWSYLGKIAMSYQDYANAITYLTSALNLSPANAEYTTLLTQARGELERLAEEEQQRLLAEEEAQKQLAEEERQKQLAAEEATRQAEEAARRAEEAARTAEAAEEAERQAAEETARQAAEAARQAEAKRQAAEEAARQAEAERIAEEQRIAEEEAARQAEEAAQQAEAQAEPVVVPESPETTASTEPQVSGGSEPSTSPVGGPVVVLDVTYKHKSPDDGGSGAFSFFKSPSSLTGDLNNGFSSGTLYQRIKVLNKPSNQVVNYQLCLVPSGDISVGPACSSLEGLSFSEIGIYESNQSVSSLSNAQGVDWSKGLSEVMLVVKDGNGNTVDDRYSYRSDTPLDMTQFYPMEVQYTAILVPEGSSFPGWP